MRSAKYLINLFLYRYFSSFIHSVNFFIITYVHRTQSILCTRSGLIFSFFYHYCLFGWKPMSRNGYYTINICLSQIQDFLILKRIPSTRQPPICSVPSQNFLPLDLEINLSLQKKTLEIKKKLFFLPVGKT